MCFIWKSIKEPRLKICVSSRWEPHVSSTRRRHIKQEDKSQLLSWFWCNKSERVSSASVAEPRASRRPARTRLSCVKVLSSLPRGWCLRQRCKINVSFSYVHSLTLSSADEGKRYILHRFTLNYAWDLFDASKRRRVAFLWKRTLAHLTSRSNPLLSLKEETCW